MDYLLMTWKYYDIGCYSNRLNLSKTKFLKNGKLSTWDYGGHTFKENDAIIYNLSQEEARKIRHLLFKYLEEKISR